jgi:class 3 adenylate cyclase/tetratricopeptide (TPR) repeat protein
LGEKIASASIKAAGERREVTVLFLEVINFTAASRSLDSEDAYELINEAMSSLVEVVRKYGGTIDKFTGNGLMALFGAPVAHENDPERAVRAALEMLGTLEPWQKQARGDRAPEFQIRIGVNSGWVIAGKVGNSFHMEYTVIGDTVNLASRLEAVAEPGTVLVSTETYQRTRHLFAYKTTPPVPVKGFPEPVQAYRPHGYLDKPAGGRFRPGVRVAMVGRREELNRLQAAVADVRQNHHRRIIFVTGEAGLGKSRLISELQQGLADSDARVFQGACSTYSRATPLSLVANLLRNLLGLSDGAAAEAQRETLQTYLGEHDLANDDILPYVLHIFGLSQSDPRLKDRLDMLDPLMLQRQTHSALRKLFLAEAGPAPTVLILEDLHWVDPASRDFLEYFVQTSYDVPLLMIFVSREAERNTVIRPLLEAATRQGERFDDVQLKELTTTEQQLLIDQLIDQATAEASSLKRRIALRADGNPFYIEQIIQMLIDQGGLVLAEADGDLTVRPEAEELLNQIPGTVKGLILARIDRLPESVRQTLQKAAVLGSSFPVSLLHALNGLSIRALGTHLAELEARQFLGRKPYRLEAGYTFRHSLLQEMVYHTLLKRDRRNLHTKAAEAIDGSLAWPPDEKTEALAYHYFESNQPVKATPHLIEAADKAAGRCANETAVGHYRRAGELLVTHQAGQDQEYFHVRIGLGRALKFVGELKEAGQVLSDAVDQLSVLSPVDSATVLSPALVECLVEIADVCTRVAAYEDAYEYLEAGLQVPTGSGDQQQTKEWLAVIYRMAVVRFRQGQLDDALALATTAISNLNPADIGDPAILASLYNMMGLVSWQQGDLDRASGYLERSLRMHQSVGYLWGQAVVYGNMGVIHDIQGNWPRAIEFLDRAYSLQDTVGDKNFQVINLNNLGVINMRNSAIFGA